MSCNRMSMFLSKMVNDADIVNDIEGCIMATKSPRSPLNLLQEIGCDADTFHFGTGDFMKMNNLVRRELELKYGDVHIGQFNEDNIKMLEQHRFYTDYCNEYLKERKENILNELRNQALPDHEMASVEAAALLVKEKLKYSHLTGDIIYACLFGESQNPAKKCRATTVK